MATAVAPIKGKAGAVCLVTMDSSTFEAEREVARKKSDMFERRVGARNMVQV